MFQRYAKQQLECSVQSCAEDQNFEIVRCPLLDDLPYQDFWRVTRNRLKKYFFREGYNIISNLRAEIPTRSLIFYHVAKEARKTRSRRRRRIRTEQNSPMGFRPLDESAPSARKYLFFVGGSKITFSKCPYQNRYIKEKMLAYEVPK